MAALFGPTQATCAVPNKIPLFSALAITLAAACSMAWLIDHAIAHPPRALVTTFLVSLAAFVAGMLATAVAWIARPVSRHHGIISVDENALRFDDRQLLARHEIECTVLDDDRAVVRIVAHGELAAELTFADRTTAAALVDAMPVPLTTPITLVARGTGTKQGILAIYAGFVIAAALYFVWRVPYPLGLLLALPGAVMALTPARITAAADGLKIRWLWSHGFVPFTAIEAMTASGSLVTVRLQGGRVLHLGMRDARVDPTGGATARALEQRLLALRNAALSVPLSARMLAARGTGETSDWLARLRSLSAGSYRQAAVTVNDLWAVVRDATAEESARVGAAAALRSSLSPREVTDLRALGEACASPRLRVALQRVAEESDPLPPESVTPEWARAFDRPAR
jgi:hypothetical protein